MSVILEEENEESPDKQPALQQTKTFLRLTTVGKGKNKLVEEDEGALIEMQDLSLQKKRNMSVVLKKNKDAPELLSARSEPESQGLLDWITPMIDTNSQKTTF